METRSRWQNPALVLVVLAPLIGEVLNGATRLSYIFAFVPQLMVWGCGALLIREVGHRFRGAWTSILLMGLALSTWVELVVLQTSLAPIPWLALMQIPAYGRIFGVNWLWLWFMLGYEAVWIVLLPILITELVFPGRRNEAWLGGRGLVAAAVVFAVGSLALWAIWTQTAVPFAFKQPKYWPPVSALLIGVLVTVALVLAAYALRMARAAAASGPAPSPWLVGVGAAAFSLVWWILIVLVFAPSPSLPLWVPLAAGAVWAAAAYVVIRRWSSAITWGDRHGWALAFAALMVCMVAGYLGSSTWPKIDLVAKVILNVVAVERMMALARVVWRRPAPAAE